MGASRRTGISWRKFTVVPAVGAVVSAVASATAFAQMADGGRPETRVSTRPATRPASGPAAGTTSRPDENTADGLVALGRQSADLKKYDEAQAYYRRALEKDSKNIAALAGMAATLLKQNKASDAITYYIQGAQAGIATGGYSIAEQLLQEAAAIDPNNPQVLLGLAQVFQWSPSEAQRRQRQQLAITMYRRFIKAEPNNYEVYLALGKLQLMNGYAWQAIQSLQEADRLHPDDAEILSALATAYRGAKNRIDKAEKAAAAAVATIERMRAAPDGLKRITSAVAGHYSMYAGILLDEERLAEAEEQARRGLSVAREKLQQSPDDVMLVNGMLELGRTLDAILKKRLEREPQNASLLASRARLLAEMGDLNQTITLDNVAIAWADAAKYAPKDIDILKELAAAQYRVKRMTDAAEACRKILAMRPDEPFAKDLLARIGPAATKPASTTQPTTRP